MSVAPIEYMKWPVNVPRPSFDEIVGMAIAVMGLDTAGSRHLLVSGKSAVWKTARQLVQESAQHLAGMSMAEVAGAMGYAGTSAMRNRSGKAKNFFAGTNASVAMVNEVTYCLLRNKLERVAADRRKCRPLPGDYGVAARDTLRNHAGGSV